MRRTVIWRAATACAVVVLAAVGGCTASGGGEDPDAISPFQAIREQIYGSDPEAERDQVQREYEEAIAACMAEQGFEYLPRDLAQDRGPTLEELGVELEGREFVAQYGYSMMSDPVRDSGWQPSFPEDPNESIVMSLSEAEREAYYLALDGDQPFPEPGFEDEWVYDPEQAGCQGRAADQVYVEPEVDEGFADLIEEMGSVWERTMADERIAAAVDAWAACMVDAGYPRFTTVLDANNWVVPQVNGFDGSEPERLRLQQLEIDTALDDYDCLQAADYDHIVGEVTFEYEQAFVDAHREELDAWVEAYREARG